MQTQVLPESDVTSLGLEGVIHHFALAWNYGGIVAAMEEPDWHASDASRVLLGQRCHVAPTVGCVTPEDAGSGKHDRRPSMRIVPRQLPSAIAAERQSHQIGAIGIGMELARFLIERGHRHLQHLRIGPEMAQWTLRHHDNKGPSLGMIANLLRQTDLRLPHAFAAPFAPAVEKQDDRPGPGSVRLRLFCIRSSLFRACTASRRQTRMAFSGAMIAQAFRRVVGMCSIQTQCAVRGKCKGMEPLRRPSRELR